MRISDKNLKFGKGGYLGFKKVTVASIYCIVEVLFIEVRVGITRADE